MKAKKRPKLTPQQKIMRAAERGTGLRLSRDEVLELSEDEAIRQCSWNDADYAAGRTPDV